LRSLAEVGVMDNSIRVMVEFGKKKRTVAAAFDWPGWDRSGKSEEDALRVLAAYRQRYGEAAALAGLADEFLATGEFAIVQRQAGIGMTDYYGASGRWAGPEEEPMSEAACERKIALLQASWATFDAVAARVSPELRKGPAEEGASEKKSSRHANGAEIYEFAPKVGVKVPLETRGDPEKLRDYRGRSAQGFASSPRAEQWQDR